MHALVPRWLIVLCGFAPGFLPASVQRPPSTLIDMGWLSESLAQANTVTFFEGLPRRDEESFKSEMSRVPVLVIDEQYFYARPLVIRTTDQTEISRILQSSWFIVPPTTAGARVKFCGGFHADYGIRLAKDDKLLAYILICFGCGDIRFVHGDDRIATELTAKGRSSLRNILITYRQERPEYRPPRKKDQPVPLSPPPKIEPKPWGP